MGEKAKIFWDLGERIEDILKFEEDRSGNEIFTHAISEPFPLDIRKITGPKLAKSSLEKVPHVKNLSEKQLDLGEIKESDMPIEHKFFSGRIVKIEKEDSQKPSITVVLKLNYIYKNPSPKFVLADFITTPSTNYLKPDSTGEAKSIEFEQIKVGNKVLLATQKKVTTIESAEQFTCIKILVLV